MKMKGVDCLWVTCGSVAVLFFTCFMKPLLYEAAELHEKKGHVQLKSVC